MGKDTEQQKAGTYFTPKGITKILDPSCGAGGFLLHAKPKDEKADPSDVVLGNPPFEAGHSRQSGADTGA